MYQFLDLILLLLEIQGPVVQNFVSLTVFLSPQFLTIYGRQKQIHCYFVLKKCENPLQRILTFFQHKITVYL